MTALSQSQFWKTVVSGIIIITGLAGGIIGWGMQLNNACVVHSVKSVEHERRIVKLETIIEGIDKKLDIVVQQTTPRGN